MTVTVRTSVKLAHMAVLSAGSGVLVTHALGSCIGVTVYDPVARVGGLLHFMLPMPGEGSGTLAAGPHAYCSSAVPELFRAAYAAGAHKSRIVVCAAGGAETLQGGSALRIGARNWTLLRKVLWKNNVPIGASEVGGTASRNLELNLGDGTVTVTSGDRKQVIWQPAA